jgi:hypothetical protein
MWNAASAVVTRDAAGNRKLDKSQGRIDGLVALAMAVSAAMIRPPEPVFDVEA